MRKTFFLAFILWGILSANAASWYAPDNNYPQPQDTMERSLKKINSLVLSNLVYGPALNANNLTNVTINIDVSVLSNLLYNIFITQTNGNNRVNQGALTNTVDWVTFVPTGEVATVTRVTNALNVVLQFPSTSVTNGSFLLSCTGDTNVPVQLSATNFPVHSVTLTGYSNRVINTSTIWVQYSGDTNGQAVPLTAGNAMNISAPEGALLNLSNVWVQAETTNDSVGVLYLR